MARRTCLADSARKVFAILLGLMMGALLVACGNQSDPAPSWSLRSADGKPDAVSIKVPDGWFLVDRDEGKADAELTVSRTAGAKDDFSGFTILNSLPGDVVPPDGPADVENYLHKERDHFITDRSVVPTSNEPIQRYFTDATSLPDRKIDGNLAAGMSGLYHSSGVDYSTQVWFVWRSDGLWEIWTVGLPGGDGIPQELLDAIDTIHWTPSGDGTGTK